MASAIRTHRTERRPPERGFVGAGLNAGFCRGRPSLCAAHPIERSGTPGSPASRLLMTKPRRSEASRERACPPDCPQARPSGGPGGCPRRGDEGRHGGGTGRSPALCRSERRFAPMTCAAYERGVSACLDCLQGEGIGDLAEVCVTHLRDFLAEEQKRRPVVSSPKRGRGSAQVSLPLPRRGGAPRARPGAAAADAEEADGAKRVHAEPVLAGGIRAGDSTVAMLMHRAGSAGRRRRLGPPRRHVESGRETDADERLVDRGDGARA